MNKEQIALKAIIKSSGTPWGEEGIDKFYAHHIKELSKKYWKAHAGVERPSREQMMDILVLRGTWGDGETYDFTLPEDATEYVVSVTFDDKDKVIEIVMED